MGGGGARDIGARFTSHASRGVFLALGTNHDAETVCGVQQRARHCVMFSKQSEKFLDQPMLGSLDPPKSICKDCATAEGFCCEDGAAVPSNDSP